MARSGPTIVFDLDGTLADTGPDLLASLNHCLAEDGFEPLGISQIGHLVGHGSLAMIRRAYELAGRSLEKDALARHHQDFLAFYEANIAGNTRMFPGADALLDELEAADCLLAICTNKYEGLARLLLERLGVSGRFAAICGGDSFDFRKPDGRHVSATIERAGGEPARAVMVGDTVTDASAARDCGVALALVSFGYSDLPVAALDPDLVIDDFARSAQSLLDLANASTRT